MTDVRADADQSRAGLRWWKEALLAAAVYAVYSIVRNQFGSAGGDPGPAFGHAKDIIAIEDALHLYFEPHAPELVPRPARPTASSGCGTCTTASPTSW